MFAQTARIMGRRLGASATRTMPKRQFSSGGGGGAAPIGLGLAGVAVGAFAYFQVNQAKEELKELKTRLDNNDIDAAAASNQAFVFIKPHAVTEPVKKLVSSEFAKMGIRVTGQGMIDASTIDKNMLIDTHYGAIANRAVKQKPADLAVTDKAAGKFEKAFGVTWADAVAQGKVFNAADACEKLGIDGSELGARFDTLTRGKDMIKFGGGFYLGQVGDIYVVNGFYMNMREKYTKAGEKIYYYTVDFPANNLSWEAFRAEKLGATDPSTAATGSLRQQVYQNWKKLGLNAQPNTGDNSIHASASPYEALAERINWLGAKPGRDTYGKGLIASGVPAKTIVDWSSDPQVKGGSIFDALEDLGAKECMEKAATMAQ